MNEVTRSIVRAQLSAGHRVVVFLQAKLGGEISVSATDRSPELAFDSTLVEIRQAPAGTLSIGRYGILEIQTMDFHGSYREAVKNLRDALRLHKDEFPQILGANPQWLSESIEGPNIANVFKRTFYQMVLKFRIGASPSCTGCVIAIPAAVWDSWQRHLGRPDLQENDDGTFSLKTPGTADCSAWIYVFDIEANATTTPNPIVIRKRIATNADSIADYALRVAPEAAIASGAAAGALAATIRRRLAGWWPELGVS
jgi:hypothetical protein